MDIIFEYRGRTFEWDENKADSNIEKHGIDFFEAADAFFDERRIVLDAARNFEVRYAIIGFSRRLRLLCVVYAEPGEIVRIISARSATRAETDIYERYIG